MEVKVAEKWKIWNKEKEVAKSEEDTKKLVPPRFVKDFAFIARPLHNLVKKE